MSKVGYARVSTTDQHADIQVALLEKEGCDPIFTETASGGKWERLQLQACLAHLRKGDVLYVWKLDRLSRSLVDLLRILIMLREKEVGFHSMTESLDTTTPAGRLMMSMLGAFAEFEKDIIRQRTKAGLDRARQLGHLGGGKHVLSEKKMVEIVRKVKAGEMTQAEAAREERVCRATIHRMMRTAELKEEKRLGLNVKLV